MKFIPSSPTLMNGGTTERLGTLSSCFPMDIEDSIEGIFEALKECAIVTKMGGGIGVPYFKLRSSGEIIKTLDGRKSSGPLPFISIFNEMLDGVNQGGVRRGAAMGLLTADHPSILEFIQAKKDLKKFNRLNFSVMISDSFYKDLKENPDIPHTIKNVTNELISPLLNSDGEVVTVKQLWDIIVENAWSVAEPGIFNTDIAYKQCTVTNENKTVVSNPCLTGDTLVAVADGRGSVSIKQLVDEGKDVPVYTLDKQGDLRIKIFLNPRLTQKNADIYEVSFDSGLTIKCTDNHEFLTTSGTMVPLKDLKKGSSIKSIIKNYRKPVSKEKEYCTITTNGIIKSEHRLIAAYFSGKLLSEGEVVHHINHDSLDNRPENLQIMNYKAHDKLHGKDKLGKNNPVFKIKDRESWIKKQRELNQGLKNSNSKNISNEEIVGLIKKYSKNTLYNFFTLQMWKSLDLPLLNTNNKGNKYRYNNPKEYCDLAKVEYIESLTYHKLLKQYNNLMSGKQIFKFDKKSLNFIIYKKCEYCGKEFIVDYDKRQRTFCSHSCCVKEIQKPFMFENSKFSKKYLDHPNTKRRLKLTLEMFKTYKKFGSTYTNFGKECKGARTIIRHNNIFCPSIAYLKNNINKVISAKDLIYLAEKNIKNFKHKLELKKAIGDSYNHKIISIKYIGKEDVYDGTVEETHNFLIGGREYLNKKNRKCIEYVVCSNCAEFVNIPYTSCALGSINISSLVEGRKFNWEEFEEIIIKATRFINSTIDKNKFPIKKIKEVTLKTRPIGLGVMGLAHVLYKKEIPYNSEKAFKFTEEVIRYLTLRSMQESNKLAQEHSLSQSEEGDSLHNKYGAYEAFDYDLFMKANERFFKHKICRNIDIEQLRKDIKKYGVRNSC
jgi:ribonucleotide reductase alpha subunit